MPKLDLHFNELDETNLFLDISQGVQFWNSYKIESKNWLVASKHIQSEKCNSLDNSENTCFNTTINSDTYLDKQKSKKVNMENSPYRIKFIEKYNSLLKEMILMHKNKLPLGTILDTSTSFCGKCDPLTRSWLDNKNFSKASIFLVGK